MSMTTLIGEVASCLGSMKESSKVDSTIVEKLNVLKNEISNCKKQWVTDENVGVEDSFLMYHCLRNLELIVEKAQARFSQAIERHENPLIIENAMLVFPYVFDLYTWLYSLQGKVITTDIRSMIWKRLRQLRSMASNVSLIQTTQEELKDINLERVRKEFKDFARTIQAITGESESSA